MLKLSIAALVLGTGLASSVQAVTYDESDDGDLGGRGEETALGAFATGTNIVTGTLIGDDSLDVFTFTLAEGQMLTSFSYEIDNGDFEFGTNVFLDSETYEESFNTSFGSSGQLDIDGVVGPTTFQTELNGVSDSFGAESYTLTYEVTQTPAVPLPASALLLLGGVGGIMALRRRAS